MEDPAIVVAEALLVLDIAPGTVRDLVPARLALPESPGEALEPERCRSAGAEEAGASVELASARAKLAAALAERDSARAKERELAARVASLERELRAERSKVVQAERQLQTIKATNAQLMRLRQDEQAAPLGQAAHQAASRQGAQTARQPQQPALRGGRNGSARGGHGAGAANGSGDRGAGAAAPQQAEQPPHREGGGRPQGPQGQPGKGGGARAPPPEPRPAAAPAPPRGDGGAQLQGQPDPTAGIRAELRQALVAGDGQRLQMAVQQAEAFGLEAEAAHGRKKLGALLTQ